MKKVLLVLAIALMAIPALAQNDSYTRGRGFFIRPELYGGLFVNVGYQINPYVQLSVGPGGSLLMSQSGSNISVDFTGMVHGGVRIYTNDKPWAGMIDYHAGVLKNGKNLAQRHSLVGGASYKDLDFGGGLQIMFGPNAQVIGYGPLITVGYNIRFYEH